MVGDKLHSYKEDTHINRSAAEEAYSVGDGTLIEGIWTLSDQIPEVEPDSVGSFYGAVFDQPIEIVRKYSEILEARHRNTFFTHDNYKNVIFRKGYSVKVVDADGEVIPFGYSGMRITRDGISFKQPVKEFKLPLKATWSSYTGPLKTLTEYKAEMAEGYEPTKDRDLTTKEYVDSVTSEITSLRPQEPADLSKAKLTILNKLHDGFFVLNNKATKFEFEGKPVEIDVDPFYLEEGPVSLKVGGYSIASFDPTKAAAGDTYGPITVEDIYDPYETAVVGKGYYKVVKLKLSVQYSDVYLHINYTMPEVTLHLEQDAKSGFKTSEECNFSYDGVKGAYSITNFRMTKYEGAPHYVSGTQVLSAGDKLTFAFDVKGLKKVKNEQYVIIESTIGSIAIPPQEFYATIDPSDSFEFELMVPDGIYLEGFDIDVCAYNVVGSLTAIHSHRVPYIIDTISDESDRLDLDETEFNATRKLNETPALECCNVIYRYPENRQYTKRISDTADLIVDTLSTDKYAERFAIFSRCIDWTNHVCISFLDLQNAEFDRNHFIKDLSLKIKVVGSTGWLDVDTPYEVLTNPSKEGDACMVINKSENGTFYCTFGTQAKKGDLLVKVGLKKGSKISFRTVDIC